MLIRNLCVRVQYRGQEFGRSCWWHLGGSFSAAGPPCAPQGIEPSLASSHQMPGALPPHTPQEVVTSSSQCLVPLGWGWAGQSAPS